MAATSDSGSLALSGIRIRGFKSIEDSGDIELRQLTILAGANSAGKSSPMEPLLLLKQTLETPFDPGPLKLDGPIVAFDRFEEAAWHPPGGTADSRLTIRLCRSNGDWIEEEFSRDRSGRIVISGCSICDGDAITTTPEGAEFGEAAEDIEDGAVVWHRAKCWLIPKKVELTTPAALESDLRGTFLISDFERALERMLFVPSERSTRSRRYPTSASGPAFPGMFHHYAASVVLDWQERGDARLPDLSDAMSAMGLAWKIEASRVNDAWIELRVNMRPRPGPDGSGDTANIADVGRGVSHALPVVVALFAADPPRMVYVEAPESHLHPRAQHEMAKLIADAAKRGVQLVIETHSELLLMGIQTLVAQGKLDPALVKLHWFERDPETGATTITSADLDENGAFGDWPEDFGRVNLDAQRAYLEAGYD